MGAKVTVAALDGPQPEAMVAAPEAAAHPAPPVASKATPVPRRTEGVTAQTDKELSLSLTLGGSRPPVWDEHPLQWGSPQDPSSAIFTLDYGAEGMDREGLGNGIMAMLDALNHA